MWDLPRPGLEPVSPALAGGFLTTSPPGKSPTNMIFNGWYLLVFWKSKQYGKIWSKMCPFLGPLVHHHPPWSILCSSPKDSVYTVGEGCIKCLRGWGTNLCWLLSIFKDAECNVAWINPHVIDQPLNDLQSCYCEQNYLIIMTFKCIIYRDHSVVKEEICQI